MGYNAEAVILFLASATILAFAAEIPPSAVAVLPNGQGSVYLMPASFGAAVSHWNRWERIAMNLCEIPPLCGWAPECLSYW